MSNPLMQTIEALAKEKGIEADVVIGAIEDAVLTASRKYYKTTENLKTRFNTETGQVDLFAVKQIVREVTNPATEISLEEAQQLYGDEAEVDMEIEFPKPTDVLGRIAAQTAKQVIFQKVREAERDNIFAEYSGRIGEVVNATVKRFENGDMVVELGRIEASLPRKEQSRAESYAPGERLRAVIKGVNRSAKGPQIVLSRTDPALLVKLFEQEVPEIYDGTVQIRGAVREAGDRAKVAVFSRERDVDPVGACVGMKGTRVQAIIRELRGEKIDIVEWSDDPVSLVTNALSPAKVQRVSIVDDKERVVEVVVEDKQLSLAIGKKGQNVRLAAKLTGWRIDIKSEEEKRREVEAQLEGFEVPAGGETTDPLAAAREMLGLTSKPAEAVAAAAEEVVAVEEPVAAYALPGVGEKTIKKLVDAGFDSAEKVAAASVEALSEVQGIGAKTAERILAAARGETPAESEEAIKE
ncbi:MAG: transcription termination factor NusA [Vicinamibacterales bacterium]|nr:transcription termination factor NusA [Vicinamibacterales bacterium]